MIVKVVNNCISFGCMKGQNFANGEQISILLYESLADATRVRFVPRIDELLFCEYFHNSVCKPIALVDEQNLCLRGSCLPHDLLYEYFPILVYDRQG